MSGLPAGRGDVSKSLDLQKVCIRLPRGLTQGPLKPIKPINPLKKKNIVTGFGLFGSPAWQVALSLEVCQTSAAQGGGAGTTRIGRAR